jgi:tetratricopeptide (TPR) repeat protein
VKKSSRSVISTVHAARKRLRAGDTNAAMTMLDDINPSGLATYHIVRAEALYALHKYADATRECELALEASPNSPRPAILLELTNEMLTLDQWVKPQKEAINLVAETAPALPRLERQAPPAPSPSEITSGDEKPGLVSETLAQLLTKQGKYAEARKIYIQLSRKHPERDGYFHERIVEIEQMMQSYRLQS